MSCESQIEPLQLRFSNVTLTNDGQASLNGIALQVGSPEQIISLTPSTLLSNTILSNRETCGSDASVSCIAAIGGGYEASASSSFRATTGDSWNGSTEVNVDFFINQPATYLNDILTVASNQSSHSLPGFPLALSITKTAAYSELGLGRNSTFISRLYEAGLTPSLSWSFFTGVYSRIRAGSLIIGGYSDRFYEGTLFTSNVSDVCDVCFEIASMDYQQGNSKTSLMPDGNITVTAAVDPYFLTMAVSDEIFYKFGNATNGTVASLWHTYSPDAVPTGNVTITLANGLSTTIPNNALFNPPSYDNGELVPYHNGSSTVFGVFSNTAVNWLQMSANTNIVVFGMPYAAMVYLVRDFARDTISIANANQDAQIGGNAISICPLYESSQTKVNHTGAIVGGVIGGIIGSALILFVAWFFWRRKRKVSALTSYANVEGVPARGKPISDGDTKDQSTFEKPAGSGRFAQEVSTEGAKFEVLGDQGRPYEMSAEGRTSRSELSAWKEQKT